MDKFWELMEKNVLVSSTIAVMMVGTACYMWATGALIPSALEASLMLVLGYFLGAKAQQATNSAKARRVG